MSGWLRIGGSRAAAAMRRTVRRSVLFASFALAFAIVSMWTAAPAHATAVLTTTTPAPGGTRTELPIVVAATFDDTSTVLGTSQLSIDGTQAAASFSYPVGYWYDDGCDVWWVVTDDTVGRLGCTLNSLTDGAHDATVTVHNSAAQTNSVGWSFFVSVPPAMGAVTPGDGAYVFTATPTISATVVDNDAGHVGTMTLDSAVVTATYDPATKRFSCVPETPLETGSHAVTMTVEDAEGRTATRSWSFNVSLTAVVDFSLHRPAPSSTVTSTPMSLSVRADDRHYAFSGTAASGQLYIDGTPRSTSVSFPIGYWYGDYDEFGDWYWEYIVTDSTVIDLTHNGPAPPDGAHTATVRATNVSGLSTETSWPFEVSIAPTIGVVTPADGAIAHTVTPTISAVVADNDTAFDATMSIDGSIVVPSYIASARRYSYVPDPSLSEGLHTAYISVEDSMGRVATRTWQFEVTTAAAAGFTLLQPSPGSTVTVWSTTLGARADDREFTFSGAPGCGVLSLDGTSVFTALSFPIGYWYDDGCDVWWEITDFSVMDLSAGSGVMADGPHSAMARVTNSAALTSETAWAFYVAAGPHLSALTPVDGSTVNGLRPSVGLTASDNSTGSLSIELLVDGTPAVTETFAQGAWSWAPSADLADDTTHTCEVTVRDAASNVTTASWSFRVEQYPGMPNTQGCAECHEGFPVPNHPTGNCYACHGSSNCVDCHGYHGPEVLGPCSGCHGPEYHGNMESLHTAPMSDECRACHTSVLLREHYRWPPSGSKYTCGTCHDSTVTAVASAIASGTTSCSACHGTAADHLAQHAGSTLTKPSCGTCHVTNLEDEHVRRRSVQCRACHGRSVAALPRAGAAGSAPFEAAFEPSGFFSPAGDGFFEPMDASGYPCSSCHDPEPHGPAETCGGCHGAHEITTPTVEPTSVLGAYSAWTSSGPNAGSAPTPHKDFQLTTSKCAVCHQVHKAPLGGQVLLRSTIEGACEYCHVATDIGVVVVYGGSLETYWAYHDDAAHNRTSESSCVDCHSVHGAHTLEGPNSVKILRDWASDGSGRAYSPQVLGIWPDPVTLTDDDEQITAWCTGCHKYYVRSYDTTLPMQTFDHHTTYSWVPTVAVSHVMTTSLSSYGNTRTAVAGMQIAFAASPYCRSCHDAGGTDHGPGMATFSFPHYTKDYYQFLTVGASLESSGSSNTTGTTDGMCLKCHRSGVSGVGLTY